MKKLKKWITISMTAFFLLIISQRTLCVSAANGDIASGKDKNITWVIDGNGKLTVKGTGNFTNGAPWDAYRLRITSATVQVTGSPSLQIKKTSYNSVTLKWSKVAGAKKYEIFYADSLDGEWHSLGLKGGTSFTHKKLMTGATYYYQIRPIRDSFYGRWSNGVSTTTFLDNVNKLKVKAASADRMKLTWKKVKGAAYYVILRADSIDGTYEMIAHATKSSYIDTGLQSGTTYFYKVYAVSGPYKTKETAPVGQTTKIAKK